MDIDNSYAYLDSLDKLIKEKPDVSQRDVSKALQMSLGMTNSLLKRFTEKGWIFMHKVNAKNIRYVLTPAGMNELAERSYSYIKRTMKSVVQYRDIFIKAVFDAQKLGCVCVQLAGTSDFLFLIEHACEKNALKLRHTKKPEQSTQKELIFFADSKEFTAFKPTADKPEPVCVDIVKLFY